MSSMLIKNLNPYICCNNGDAEKAIRLYETALGAKVECLMRYSEGDCGVPIAEEHKNLVMHSALSINGRTLMVSDAMPGQTPPLGGQVSVALEFTRPEEMARAFDALSKGGAVTMPIADTFWGAKFGMLNDAHGVQWMMNCMVPKE